MSYRTVDVNEGLSRVFLDDELVGYVRLGLDQRWYPMLPHEINRGGAVQRVILANEALREFRSAFESSAT